MSERKKNALESTPSRTTDAKTIPVPILCNELPQDLPSSVITHHIVPLLCFTETEIQHLLNEFAHEFFQIFALVWRMLLGLPRRPTHQIRASIFR